MGWLGWLAGWLAGWFAGWFAGWLAGCLVGWLAGWLACRLLRGNGLVSKYIDMYIHYLILSYITLYYAILSHIIK